MKSQAFASAWISPLATSVPALPDLPCPLCSMLLVASSLCPGICQRRSSCSSWLTPLGHSRHTGPLSSSSHLCKSRCYIREPQELKQTFPSQSDPANLPQSQSWHSDIFWSSLPRNPHSLPHCPLQYLQIPDCTLVLPTSVGKPHHRCNLGQSICLPNFVSQTVSLERAV